MSKKKKRAAEAPPPLAAAPEAEAAPEPPPPAQQPTLPIVPFYVERCAFCHNAAPYGMRFNCSCEDMHGTVRVCWWCKELLSRITSHRMGDVWHEMVVLPPTRELTLEQAYIAIEGILDAGRRQFDQLDDGADRPRG